MVPARKATNILLNRMELEAASGKKKIPRVQKHDQIGGKKFQSQHLKKEKTIYNRTNLTDIRKIQCVEEK